MLKITIAVTLGAFFLVASCSSAFAWVGQTAHDWSFVIPATDMRFGIVEWQTGTTTVFLGVFDFPLPCGAFGAASILGGFSVVIVGTFALFIWRRRRHKRAL